MHQTAQMVMEEHAGYFPKKYDELIKLKGIGEYTAAAISSFSANEAKAVVDGNVFRVLARYFAIEEPINSSKAKKLFTEIANNEIDPLNPAISNQALMEFGALHCRPKNPLCQTCPLQISCQAYHKGMINTLPVKLKKAPVRNRHFNYLVFCKEGKMLMNKRGPNDIWQNLYEFPLIETEVFHDASEIVNIEEFTESFGNSEVLKVFGPVKHILSHQKIQAQFIVLNTTGSILDFAEKGWFFVDIDKIDQLGQPQLIFNFLKNFLT